MDQITENETGDLSSRWQKTFAWISAFGEAMDFDASSYNTAAIEKLRGSLLRIENRLAVLEQRNQSKSLRPI